MIQQCLLLQRRNVGFHDLENHENIITFLTAEITFLSSFTFFSMPHEHTLKKQCVGSTKTKQQFASISYDNFE